MGNDDFYQPLMYALIHNRPEFIKLILEHVMDFKDYLKEFLKKAETLEELYNAQVDVFN